MKIDNKIANKIKEDFPILNTQRNGKKLIYLDNAATTQKPVQVIKKIKKFYEEENSNIHRGVYSLSQKATEAYLNAHKEVSKLINSEQDEIIFTRNTTESINLLVYTIDSLIEDKLKEGKNEILITEMEHHSNFVPWMQLAKHLKMNLKFIKINPKTLELDYEDAKNKVNEKTAIVSVAHVSNVLGTINDIKKIVNLAKEKNAIVIIDGAQSISHLKINVKDIDCDFFAFSAHKMFGPDGIGVLYGKKHILEKLRPFMFGGDMINSVSFDKVTYNDLPMKFEAGTPNISGAISFVDSINYLNSLGIENIHEWEKELLDYAFKKLKSLKNIEVYSPENNNIGIISFNLKGIHAHDISSILDDENICVRAGYHCAMPLMEKLNLNGTVRISLCFYNTFEDIDKLTEKLIKIQEKFEK